MHSTASCKRKRGYLYNCRVPATQLRLRLFFITALYILVPFVSICQNLSISVKNANLEKVFRQIEKQSPYRFVYSKEALEDALPVSIEAEKASLQQVLSLCFNGQPLTYNISDNIIMIKAGVVTKTEIKTKPVDVNKDVSGKITNEQGEPLAGATVSVKGHEQATATDLQGIFTLKDLPLEATLIISNIGYNKQTVAVGGKTMLFITLTPAINTLDETVVIAYGKTTRRFNTGNVGRVTAEEISKQPVSNPLAALQGRVPGLLITQRNGLPGSAFTVQLRGINSLKQGTQPLFIIDGMPLMLNTGSLSQLAPDIQSLLNTINPSDIESIEVLKDADATAIYGSQGANGVVLITTKKSKDGKTKFDI
jgi:TonB-dependent SusC/RagA subfamily outer membrane receptor